MHLDEHCPLMFRYVICIILHVPEKSPYFTSSYKMPYVQHLHSSSLYVAMAVVVLVSYTDISPVVNITECSVERLTLRVLEKFGINHYLFIAACKDHGRCVSETAQAL